MNVNYHLILSPSSLEINYRPVDKLRSDPASPRCHSNKQVRQIAESIKAVGFNVPILIDRELLTSTRAKIGAGQVSAVPIREGKILLQRDEARVGSQAVEFGFHPQEDQAVGAIRESLV